MSNVFEILDDEGNVVNTIIATIDFVNEFYPGHYREQYRPPVYTWVITKVAFRFRLTDAEYTAILAAAKTDVEVQAWYETFNMVATVDLDNQRTKDGVANLVSKNLLTQQRADEILTAPVQQGERA
jgi:hypothetical protein